jgi:DNA-directed RNA polymerase specialized sigma24 family protein
MVSIALARAQAGDRCAFTFLYVRYADDIYEFARSIVNDCAEAQDITRQVFAELIGMIGEYQEREAPFLPWLQRVARAPCPPLAQEVSASTNVVPRRVSR